MRTLREDPADAEVASHRLLVRAGYIRRAAPGAFTWLPLGWDLYRRVENVIRAEMDAAGFHEVHFPALLPREPYEATNRWNEYGDTLFRLVDRRGADFLLAPTHEEMFTLLVKDLVSSYKDLPLSLYQIQTKYRDEARPRAGLLRGREFVMKDSYSFDIDDDGLAASYQAHRDAYVAAFDRLGVPYEIVSATSGAMGGSASEEFLAPLAVGEDSFVRCGTCDYAANTEAVTITVDTSATTPNSRSPAQVIPTPDTPTIDTLVDHLNQDPDLEAPTGTWRAADTLKNVVVMVRTPDGTRTPLVIGVPGDREVDTKRLEARLAPDEVEAFTEEDFARWPQLVKGYIGPGALGESRGIRYLVDPRVSTGTAWVTGADQVGHHVVDLVCGRDFTPDGVIDVAEIRAGDPCPNCGGDLEIARGIEIGHIFQLGRKYAEALGLKVLDQNGKQVTVTMGSYGIGVSRLVAVLAEVNHDDKGLCWPIEVAPAPVHLVVAGKDEALLDAALAVAGDLDAHGIDVLVDDRRSVSPGVKFNDAELMGMPYVLVVGKGLAQGTVEVRDRRLDHRHDLEPAAAIRWLVDQVAAARPHRG